MLTYKKLHLLGFVSAALIFLILVSSAASAATEQGVSSVKTYAYISNSGSNNVSVIDTTTDTVIATVPVGKDPLGVAVSPDGRRVYVANYLDNTVSVIDTATNTVTATLNVGRSPNGVAVNQQGTKVYVTNTWSGNISVIDTATNNVTASVMVGSMPSGVAVNQQGTRVYVANCNSNTVSIIDTATNTVIATVPVENWPSGVAVNPTGTKIYVTNSGYEDLPENTISVIDAATNTVTVSVEVGNYPYGVAINPEGTKVYVVNQIDSTVSVIDAVTNTVTSTVDIGYYNRPYGVAVNPEGTKVYVANWGRSAVSIIDTATNKVTATVKVGRVPMTFGQFIGSVPVQELIFPVSNFSSNVTSGSSPLTVQFTDLSENATAWNWDFGDEDTSTDQNPVHTFSEAGEYTVNLTVSNENGIDSKVATINVSKNDGNSTISIDVPANPLWTDTGLKVVKGQTVSINAHGTWSTGSVECGPDGDDDTTNLWDLFLTSTAPSKHGELIAFVGSQSTDPYQGYWGDGLFFPQPTGEGYWAIGSSATFIADRDGELWLGINDDAVSKSFDDYGSLSTTVTITTPVDSLPYYSGNGHYYNVVSVPEGITWTDAKKAAESSTYLGINGHLATITSQGENDFVYNNLGATSSDYWLGAFQTDGSQEPNGGWQWVTGEPWDYTNWDPGEPSNAYWGGYSINLPNGYPEDALHFHGSSRWNDLPKECPVPGYVVEYEALNPNSKLPVANFSTNVTSGYVPLSVQLTDLSENATEWSWDFGDGNTSHEQNPIHAYSAAGTYTINLTVSNKNGTDSKIATITVTNPIIPPQSVSDIQSSNGSTWINWTWTNPTDTDFNHTEIYLNGIFQSNISDEYFNATGLQPETTYMLSTRTADNNGNVNDTWVNSTVTTGAENTVEDLNVSISTDKSTYNRGETVHITGKAQHTDGSPVANATALLNIKLKGYTQTYSLVTDSKGDVSYDFKPGKTEAGSFTAKLSVNSNEHLMSAETSFNMYGLYMTPSGTIDYEMSKNSSENITFSLWNYGETDLHGLNITLDGDTVTGIDAQVLPMPSETLAAGAQGSFIVKIDSANVDVSQVNYTVKVTTNEGSSEDAKLFVHFVDPRPAAIVSPMSIEVGMNPGNSLVKTIDISNVGHESMNDITISKPSHDWVSVSSASLGSISPGMNKSFNIFLNPGNNTSVGVYEEAISISSSNHQTINIYLRISVTSSEKGDLTFHVVNDIGENISGASIEIQNPAVLTEIFTGTTDENGYYNFENISAGTYNYFVRASDHAVSGSSIVSPGIQTLIKPVLPTDILGVKLNVTLVKINDDYVITPNFTFETDVPQPLLIPDPVAIIYGVDRLNPVYEKDGNITISNSGLISVFNVTVDSSSLQGVDITFPTGKTFFVDEVKAKSSITIPYHLKVTVACGGDEYRNSIRINGEYISFEPNSDVTHSVYLSSEIPVFAYMYNCPVNPGSVGTPSLIENYFKYTYNNPVASYSPIPPIEPIPQVETPHERVKFNILQNAALERDAFSASLELTNKLTDKNIEDVSVNLAIKDKDGNDASNLFFVNQPSLSSINSVSGSGIISPSSVAKANWLLVPKNNAGGTSPSGRGYTVQAFINYTVNGVSFSTNSTEESITVMPQPLLNLTYTVPEKVTADKPFNLTLNVTNVGYGTAKNLKLDSGQPKIYENKAGLLVSFELIGSGLVNEPESNSMLINFGDLTPGESKEAYWVMRTSLDGNFTEFDGSFSHNNTLGGAETSLINDIKYVILKTEEPVLPVANFSSNVSEGHVPLDVQFTDLSENAAGWNWDFGDGNNSTEQNPAHTYSTAGTYTVNLTAINENGIDSKLATLTVSDNPVTVLPVANFSTNVSKGHVPLSVQFADLSENVTEWNWDFGDGATSSEQDPVHTFSAVGSYTVNLTVSNANGTDSELATITVSEKPVAILPTAAFSASPTSGSSPLTVAFTDNSKNSPDSWEWSFGDGSSSTDQNPVHTYSNSGQYTVKLIVKNAAGSNTALKSSYIIVKNLVSVPSAAFSASPTSGNAPLTVTFTDKSKNSPESWEWSFGDGSSSTDQNPVHTYSNSGQYTVKLTVKNAAGSNTALKSSYIIVKNLVSVPSAAFSASPTSGNAPLTVTFTDKSKNSPESWEWSFGDGSSSTDQNPVHTYSNSGQYTVKLTVKNAAGSNTKTMSEYVIVKK